MIEHIDIKNIQNGHDLEVPKPWPWLLDRGLKTLTLHQELFLLGVAVQELLGVGDMQSGGDGPDKENSEDTLVKYYKS